MAENSAQERGMKMSQLDAELALMRVEETRQCNMKESSIRRALAEGKTHEKEDSVHKQRYTLIILFSKLIHQVSCNREFKSNIEEKKIIQP